MMEEAMEKNSEQNYGGAVPDQNGSGGSAYDLGLHSPGAQVNYSSFLDYVWWRM
jgi:hypothetical protein